MPEEDFVTRDDVVFEIDAAIRKAVDASDERMERAIARSDRSNDAATAEQVRLIVKLIHMALVASVGAPRAQLVLDRFLTSLQEEPAEWDATSDDTTNLRTLAAGECVQETVRALLHPPPAGA